MRRSTKEPAEGTADGSAGSAVRVAEALEAWLGDPETDTNTMSVVRSLALDEQDALPEEAIDLVRSFGFHRWFVPQRLGGDLRTAEELLMLARVIARRDMTVAVSESTQLWMMLVWIGGDRDQQARAAETVLRGGVVPCLAYSEPGHGADLAANEFLAAPSGDGGYRLSGQKWPINRANTSTHVVLLGATGGEDVPANRRQSLFLVDRSRVASGQITGMDRVPTHGLHGCDISGVSFEDAEVDASTRLGTEGEGLELALRGLLVTRTFCTGLSLGAGDTLLRSVGDFLSRRELYGGRSTEIPYVAESLANAYLSLLIAECESLVAMRGLHLYADEFSVWANFAKVQVARLVDTNSKVLARVLGARYYMRASEHVGVFQKMLRDSGVVSVFDGSEPVCLDSIAVQLATMVRARRRPRDDDWSLLYDLRVELPAFDPARVNVFGRGRDAVFASLPALVARLDELSPDADCDEEQLATLRELGRGLQEEVDDLFERAGAVRPQPVSLSVGPTTSAKTTSPHLIRLAEEACGLHAKVSSLGLWLFNRDHLTTFFAGGVWLQAALARRSVHQYDVGDLDPAVARDLAEQMHRQRTRNEYFSVRTVRQAEPGLAQARPATTLAKGTPVS